jgi:RNA-binding protein YhbY
MLTKQRKKELMAQMGPQTPSVIIGKNGVTDAILEEIKSQLASKKIVKGLAAPKC